MTIGDIKRLGKLPTDMKDKSYKQYDVKDKVVDGINKEADYSHGLMKKEITKQEFGISDKRIIIPSFGTTSKLFS